MPTMWALGRCTQPGPRSQVGGSVNTLHPACCCLGCSDLLLIPAMHPTGARQSRGRLGAKSALLIVSAACTCCRLSPLLADTAAAASTLCCCRGDWAGPARRNLQGREHPRCVRSSKQFRSFGSLRRAWLPIVVVGATWLSAVAALGLMFFLPCTLRSGVHRRRQNQQRSGNRCRRLRGRGGCVGPVCSGQPHRSGAPAAVCGGRSAGSAAVRR